MIRIFLFATITLLLCTGCNPYLTKKINTISKKDKREAIYVAYPIVETRRESNICFYKDIDKEPLRLADSLTKKALHELLGNKLPVKFAELDSAEYLKTKILLDSVLAKFTTKKYKHFKISQDLVVPTDRNLILIPYYIWTRSTEDYDKGKCGKVGYRDYFNDKVCTWTRSQAYLLMINRKSKEVIFFKYIQWDSGLIFLPFEYRVTRSFRHCAKPLIRKLR